MAAIHGSVSPYKGKAIPPAGRMRAVGWDSRGPFELKGSAPLDGGAVVAEKYCQSHSAAYPPGAPLLVMHIPRTHPQFVCYYICQQ